MLLVYVRVYAFVSLVTHIKAHARKCAERVELTREDVCRFRVKVGHDVPQGSTVFRISDGVALSPVVAFSGVVSLAF